MNEKAKTTNSGSFLKLFKTLTARVLSLRLKILGLRPRIIKLNIKYCCSCFKHYLGIPSVFLIFAIYLRSLFFKLIKLLFNLTVMVPSHSNLIIRHTAYLHSGIIFISLLFVSIFTACVLFAYDLYLALPVFTIIPQNKTANVGDTVSLGCNAVTMSGQQATIQWYKNGKTIQPSTRYSLLSFSAVFVIFNAVVDDTGTYTCSATNDAGGVQTSMYLRIESQTGPGKSLDFFLFIINFMNVI